MGELTHASAGSGPATFIQGFVRYIERAPQIEVGTIFTSSRVVARVTGAWAVDASVQSY